MKRASFSLSVVLAGCATTAPAISDSQRQAFADVVRQAEAEGAATDPPEAALLLREAKSGFEYAHRLPMDPARAGRVLVKAQADAEAALRLARRLHEEQTAARIKLRSHKTELIVGPATASSAPLAEPAVPATPAPAEPVAAATR